MNPLLEDHFQKQQEEIKKWYLSLKQISNKYYQLRHNERAKLKGFNAQHASFIPPASKHISVQDLLNTLELEHGIRMDDCPELRRLLQSMDLLDSHINYSKIPLSFDDFFQLVGSDEDDNIIKRAFTGRLAIPNWKDFCRQMRKIYKIVKRNEGGHNATYIPQLAEVHPNLFGVSLMTVDGQRLSIGDSKHDFTIQSCSKVFTYCIASDDVGSEQMHKHIGYEPSGKSFNAFTLDHNRKPHNPLINSGAITTCSLIRPTESPTFRFNFIQKRFTEFAGGAKVSFDNATFLSERDTADRNFALAHYMKENNVFPSESKLDETLDLYFQSCSILVNSETLAVMASTLANGGTCPTTDKRVSSPQTVKNILQLAYSCGMYDFSGEWSVSVGLPAKSGVAGAIAVVVPGVMGLSVFSPRLDKRGNTVRGVDFCIRANKIYKWAIFDRLVKTGPDEDPNDDIGEHDVDHIEGNEDEDFMVPNTSSIELPHREGDLPPPSMTLGHGHGGSEAGQNYALHPQGHSSDDDEHKKSEYEQRSTSARLYDTYRKKFPTIDAQQHNTNGNNSTYSDRDNRIASAPPPSSSQQSPTNQQHEHYFPDNDSAAPPPVDPLMQPQHPPNMNANQPSFLQEHQGEDKSSIDNHSPQRTGNDSFIQDTPEQRRGRHGPGTEHDGNPEIHNTRDERVHQLPSGAQLDSHSANARNQENRRSGSATPPIKGPTDHRVKESFEHTEPAHTLFSPQIPHSSPGIEASHSHSANDVQNDSFRSTTNSPPLRSEQHRAPSHSSERNSSTESTTPPKKDIDRNTSQFHSPSRRHSRHKSPSRNTPSKQYYTASLSNRPRSSQKSPPKDSPQIFSQHEEYDSRRRSQTSSRRSPLIIHHSNSTRSNYRRQSQDFEHQSPHRAPTQQRFTPQQPRRNGDRDPDSYQRPHKRPRHF
mmetsp:Transcript_7422/g.27739  ORF Transcript_7422/g.27739 Transcript_7422/m.27739 type:complete len:929 (-) Transcript_7422:2768-5554(-)